MINVNRKSVRAGKNGSQPSSETVEASNPRFAQILIKPSYMCADAARRRSDISEVCRGHTEGVEAEDAHRSRPSRAYYHRCLNPPSIVALYTSTGPPITPGQSQPRTQIRINDTPAPTTARPGLSIPGRAPPTRRKQRRHVYHRLVSSRPRRCWPTAPGIAACCC